MRRMFLQLMAVAALSGMGLSAQGPGRFHDGGGVGDSASRIERRISFLTALLTLTAAQVTQATTIYTNSAAATAPLQTTLSTARDSIDAAVRSNSTSTIDQLSTQIGTLHGQILAIQNKAEAAFYAILTAEQRTRLDAVGSGRGDRSGLRGGIR